MIHSTISSHYVNVLLANVSCSDHAIQQLLLRCNIPLAILNNPQSRVSIQKFSLLLKAVQELTKDEGIGYYRRPQNLGTYDILINHMSTAENAAEALDHAVQFYNILDLGITFSAAKNSADEFRLRMLVDSDIESDWIYEEVMTKLHRLVRWLANEHIKPLKISMPFAEVKHHNEYRFLFGTPVTFGAQHAELTFAAEDLTTPLRRDNTDVKKHFGHFRYETLALTVDPKSYTEKVRLAIKDNLPDSCSYESIAEQLSIHSQTLRRRLHDEGTEFSEIKNDIIRDLAIQYISSQELSIKQIAFLLNFSAPSSFNRAFKKWTGMSPAAFQKSIAEE